MGPRFCKRGNRRCSLTIEIATGELQWGHAFVSVETRPRLGKPGRDIPSFNGATLL